MRPNERPKIPRSETGESAEVSKPKPPIEDRTGSPAFKNAAEQAKGSLDKKESQVEKLRAEFLVPFKIADRVISGDSPEEVLEAQEGSGEIIDLNQNLNDAERNFGLQWIEDKLGTKIDDAIAKERYISQDGRTVVTVFKTKFTDGWYISKWQNQGDQPSYIFWPDWVYEAQIGESGYKNIPPVKHKEKIRRAAEDINVTTVSHEKNVKKDLPVFIVGGWGETSTTHTDTLNEVAEQNREANLIDVSRVGGAAQEPEDDYPQSEYNKARALVDTLDKKEIKEVDVIAHSEGAIPAIITALKYPGRIRSIVFVDPVGLIGKHSIAKLAARYGGMIGKDSLRMATVPTSQKWSMIRALGVAGNFLRRNPVRGGKEILTITSADIYENLKALVKAGVKVAVIHGVNDSLFPMDKVIDAARQKGGIPTSSFISVKGDHRNISVHPEKYTALAVNALENLTATNSKS